MLRLIGVADPAHNQISLPNSPSSGNGSTRPMTDNLEFSDEFDPEIPSILPHDKVYLIQVGYKLFRLSGASLSLDAPLYFTAFFGQPANAEKVLFIDRNPKVFELIYNHLQGYHIDVTTEFEFVHIWLDSYYFCLRRLQKILNDEYVFAVVGGTSFKIPRALLAKTGNTPNYFSINYESLFADSRRIITKKSMIRPPPQRPATVHTRLPVLFADLLEVMKGNSTAIRDDTHRDLLIKECRYYRFLELEQRITKHSIVNDPVNNESSIVLDLFSLQPKGISSPSSDYHDEQPVRYTRPHILKEPSRVLLMQIEFNGQFEQRLVLNRLTQLSTLICTGRAALHLVLIFKLVSLEFVEDLKDGKLVLLCGLAGSKTTINGTPLKPDWFHELLAGPEDDSSKRRKTESTGDYMEFHLKRSLWKVLIRGNRARLHAVALEGYTEKSSLMTIDFL